VGEWVDLSEQHARTGGDVLVDVLTALGVDTAFGVVSVHNLPLVDALERRMRFVPVRQEQAAVGAADGYGRARQGLGVAVTSTGTGAGNAAGALVESLSAGSAVLHVTGQIDSRFLGSGRGVIHETRDQLGMLRAVSKQARSVVPGQAAGAVLQELAEVALALPAGPTSVEWPIDLQYLDGPVGAAQQQLAPAALDEEQLVRAAALLREARRPLVWAGGGAVRARAEVSRLLDATGAALVTSNSGRGVLPEDDPRCIGNFAAAVSCADLLAQADALVSIGTHFRSNETHNYRLGLPRPHVQIDVDEAAIGRVHPADVGLHGETSQVLMRLLQLLPEQGAPEQSWLELIADTRHRVRDDLAAAIGPYAEICAAMREVLPREAVLARDITIASSAWGNRLLPIYEPWTNIYPRGGGIGQGLALGIGAAVSRPDVPVAVMIGDGGLVSQLGELATLAQERPDCCVVVFNDGGYGVLRNMQDRYVGRRSGVDLATPDFAALARAFELPYARVERAGDFGAAFARLTAQDGPSVLEVDVLKVGEMPRPFTPPVDVPSGVRV
jgi:acetolactate synthase-1/2/3 large subunit